MRLFTLVILLNCSVLFAQNKIKVACIGNSISFGVGVKNPETDSYPAQLASLLGDKYEVRAFAKSGATLLNNGHRPYTKEPVYQQGLDYAADIVVIHLGVNDTDPRNWPHYGDYFVSDYVALINSYKKANPNARIIIAEITPITNYHPRFASGTYDWQVEIRKAIKNVSLATNSDLVDFYTPLHKHPGTFPDAIHPNEKGALIMATEAAKMITGNYGGLQLPMHYSDNMILQRNIPLGIRGIANSGDKVKVKIANQKHETIAEVNGKWQVELLPLQASENLTLSISTKQTKLEYKNVAVGEVWLCSGQSNMEWSLQNSNSGSSEIPQANNPNIRVFDMKGSVSTSDVAWSQSDVDNINDLNYYNQTNWKSISADNASKLSAVAYYFGKELQHELNIPIGLIINAVGGSTTESWIDRNTLERELPQILHNWTNNDFIQQWARDRALKNISNSTDKKFARHPYEPSYLSEVGIKPLEQFPIKGVIWYQGESNAHNIEAHEKLFTMLVENWRENWNNPQLPFYYVQLSSLNRPSWPTFRDSQRKLMNEIPYTGMAVCSDRGDSLDVHPRNKKDVGLRLAKWALNKTYNKNIIPSGPLFKDAKIQNNKLVVSFDYANGLQASNKGNIIGFEVAEVEGLYFPATASVESDKVILKSEVVKNPKYVRYAWQPFTRANLVNEDNLPASTFKSEITKKNR